MIQETEKSKSGVCSHLRRRRRSLGHRLNRGWWQMHQTILALITNRASLQSISKLLQEKRQGWGQHFTIFPFMAPFDHFAVMSARLG